MQHTSLCNSAFEHQLQPLEGRGSAVSTAAIEVSELYYEGGGIQFAASSVQTSLVGSKSEMTSSSFY